MFSKLGPAVTALGLAAGGSALNNPAQAQGVQVGVLTCNVSSGFRFIVGSSRAVDCTFSSPNGPPQHYVGSINKLGVDIGYLQSGVMVWSVVAPTVNFAPGSLSGSYGRATASATVGIGVGANVLIGGFGKLDCPAAGQYRRHDRSQCRGRYAEMTVNFEPS
jgi:Protein of unknown function (DUF992)